jgi:hypothetical protein
MRIEKDPVYYFYFVPGIELSSKFPIGDRLIQDDLVSKKKVTSKFTAS